MEVTLMKLILDRITVARGEWRCSAEGILLPGIHLITGRVGSGKTTLAGIISGVQNPSSGEVIREGISSCMFCQQYPEYHVIGSTLKKEAESCGVTAEKALDMAGLSGRGEDDPFRLSRGELRRFQIACLSLRDWDLLVFDEPFSGLDCREKQKESQRISALSSRIVVVFTHEQRYLPRTDYLWEVRDGVLMYRGTVPEALPYWETAPFHVRMLLEKGIIPANLTEEDLEEGLCRMQG
jgi:energy-coupling factor transport system ATP-binding protein